MANIIAPVKEDASPYDLLLGGPMGTVTAGRGFNPERTAKLAKTLNSIQSSVRRLLTSKHGLDVTAQTVPSNTTLMPRTAAAAFERGVPNPRLLIKAPVLDFGEPVSGGSPFAALKHEIMHGTQNTLTGIPKGREILKPTYRAIAEKANPEGLAELLQRYDRDLGMTAEEVLPFASEYSMKGFAPLAENPMLPESGEAYIRGMRDLAHRVRWEVTQAGGYKELLGRLLSGVRGEGIAQ